MFIININTYHLFIYYSCIIFVEFTLNTKE